MFLTLLMVTFVIALLVSFLVSRLFYKPIRQILARLVPEDLTGAWHRYLTFAIYVVGISGGVRIWSLEQYILPRSREEPALVLTSDRWTFELFRTVIGTLQSLAWLLLVFFIFALLAYVVVRGLELRREKRA
ncbi:MAG TPA: hypothetical protein VKA25_05980 [Gemmatimonadales bacterium]|nr:hypothetical protein [Gemmatimonadales bacterium]